MQYVGSITPLCMHFFGHKVEIEGPHGLSSRLGKGRPLMMVRDQCDAGTCQALVIVSCLKPDVLHLSPILNISHLSFDLFPRGCLGRPSSLLSSSPWQSKLSQPLEYLYTQQQQASDMIPFLQLSKFSRNTPVHITSLSSSQSEPTQVL